MFKSSNPD